MSPDWAEKAVHHPRRLGIEQTTVARRAGSPRETRNSAAAAQIICPDCISGLRPVTR